MLSILLLHCSARAADLLRSEHGLVVYYKSMWRDRIDEAPRSSLLPPVDERSARPVTEPFEYISKARLVYREGYRYAYLGEVIQPVIYGVQGALRQYYGAKEGPPVASTLDQIVAAVAG